MNIIEYKYQPETISPGIIHIGVGNFHRAHQAFYTNGVLEFEDQRHWAICGVNLLASDSQTVKRLALQDFDYTLTVCGRDGTDTVYEIGALYDILEGHEDPSVVVNLMANPNIRIISLTITEGGYNLEKATGNFNLASEKIQHDLKHSESPLTVFGFIASGLRARRDAGAGGITILSCDNLQHNGTTAKKAITAFIDQQDKELGIWVSENVTFPNSMVDRITPATTEFDRERLNRNSGKNDRAPVYCEDFVQWVIEDNFIAGRPAWERVGVEFTTDVSIYENMKLSLLNASHTLLSYPSFLKGHRAVDRAMKDPDIAQLVHDFMDIDITPYIEVPTNTDINLYKKTLIERFSSSSVSDQVERLCFDGVSKFPVYIIPILSKMLRDGKDVTRMAFLIAAYRHYLKYNLDDNGTAYIVNEPWLNQQDRCYIENDEALCFLKLSPFHATDLESYAKFSALYLTMVSAIHEKGVSRALKSIVA